MREPLQNIVKLVIVISGLIETHALPNKKRNLTDHSYFLSHVLNLCTRTVRDR